MAYTIKGNLDASGNITAGGKNTIRTINSVGADENGNIDVSLSNMIAGTEGDVIFFDKNNTAIPNRTVSFARIVDNDVDLQLEKNSIESFSTVFNTWDRISEWDTGEFPAAANELLGWQYIKATDKIESTINSNTLIGFISPERYNNYTFEIEISSTDTDDDWIGLCLAYYKDQDGNEHTITAMRRSGDGMFNSIRPTTSPNLSSGGRWQWRLIYNFTQGSKGEERILGQQTGTMLYKDTVDGGWNAAGPIRIKAVRSGNIITVSTTEVGNPNAYVQPLTIDLTSSPDLEKFIAPSAIGYVAFSQPAATYKTVMFSGGQNVIFDSRDGSMWTYNGTDWVKDTTNDMYDILSIGVIYSNVKRGKSYFINAPGDCRLIGGPRISQQAGNTIQVLPDGLYSGLNALSNINQYVDSINGNDNNDGSIERPLRTIKAALDKTIPGVKGYNIYLHNLGTYLLPYSYVTHGLGVSFLNYPAPDWVADYVVAQPRFEWMAAAGIPRPIIRPDVSGFVNLPGRGWNCQSLVFEQYGELGFYGCQIETMAPPSGTLYRNGIFGDGSQVCKLTLQWCDIKLQGLQLVNERIESSTSIVIHRCIFTQKDGFAFSTNPKILELAANGIPTDPNTYFPEHPYINNASMLTDVRNSVTGVSYYNGIPTNCSYDQLYGGPF